MKLDKTSLLILILLILGAGALFIFPRPTTPEPVEPDEVPCAIECGEEDDTPAPIIPPKPLTSGISGTVWLGPICPVERDPPDPNCADRPFETKLALTTADQSRTIKEFSSDANGKFNIKIQPGEYSIRSVDGAHMMPYCSSDVFKVTADAYTEIAVYCDSGIR